MARLALQTFTVHHELARDFEGTFRRLAQLGFSSYELSWIPFTAKNADRIVSLQREIPLEVLSLQVKPHILLNQKEAILSFARKVGAPAIVVSMMAPRCILGGEKELTDFIGVLNNLARFYVDNGFVFAYHHHHWEFIKAADGRSRLCHLFEATEQVRFVNDIYWTARSGMDPADSIAFFGDRLFAIHLRDIRDEKALWKVHTANCELGQGYINFPRLFEALRKSPAVYAAIEQKSKHPFVSIVSSRTFLLKEGYVDAQGVNIQ